MSDYLDCVITEHNPNNEAISAAVIWLHGLGASGHDFEPVVPQLGLDGSRGVRFVFPHAPKRPVTVNGGYIMPAWYDIFEMSIERKIDTDQIMHSAEQIGALIERELANGIAADKIVIAGFSQGGAVAYQTALSYPKRLAGLMALSTYFATDSSIDYSAANSDLPILIQHGTHDPVVPTQLGERAYTLLKDKQYPVNYLTYPMAHQVCMAQIEDIGQWLNRVLA